MWLPLVVVVALGAAPKVDQRLVGTWFAGSEPFFTLAANGTGSMEDARVKWSADGKTLTVTDEDGETDRGTYVVEGDVLTLTLGGIPVQLRRAGAKTPAASPGEEKARRKPDAPPVPQAPPTAPRGAGADQLSQLLLSSAWCSFRYNKVSGASSTSRVQFFPDGSWAMGARGETYSSGPNGTVSGQTDSSDRGQWQVRNNTLWLSEGGGPVQPVEGFSVTRNSNGYPIINADGREYSSCQ